MSEIHLNPYVFKEHTKSEMVELYDNFFQYATSYSGELDLFTYLCMHFKKEDLRFISDCFVQMICCPDLEFDITDETATKGSIEYAIVYPI
jgi:hypothetical protein